MGIPTEVADLAEPGRELDVGPRRRWITRWMIVGHHDRSGRGGNGGLNISRGWISTPVRVPMCDDPAADHR